MAPDVAVARLVTRSREAWSSVQEATSEGVSPPASGAAACATTSRSAFDEVLGELARALQLDDARVEGEPEDELTVHDERVDRQRVRRAQARRDRRAAPLASRIKLPGELLAQVIEHDRRHGQRREPPPLSSSHT